MWISEEIKMKHRVWTFTLVLTLCAALMTAGAMAAEESSVVEDMIEVLPAGSVAVNEENFPDAIFRELVNEKCANGDYVLSAEEIAAVTRMGDTSYKGISDFKGLEYFTELKHFGCAGNNLTHLDVSANTKLVELFCSYNKLTALDVSKNTELTELSCDSNALTALDVSKNTKLEMLEASDNDLTAIDVSNNTALRALSCGYNQIGALDVSKNTALESLGCMSNKLTALDVSKNTALEYLYCGENFLTQLDLSQNTLLVNLDCAHSNIKTLDLSHNPAIWQLNCASFGGSTLDISGNPKILAVYNSGEVNPYDGEPGVVSLMMENPDGGLITFRYSEGVTILTGADSDDSGDAGDESAKVTIDETNFPDETFRQYIREYIDTDGTETLSEAEIAAAKVIDLSTTGVYDLTGLAYFTALEELYCTQHSMTTLNVSANKALVVLKCGLGNLFELNVSGNAALEVLECYNNQLTMLDVSGCPALTKLDCEYNDLCYLDVSTNENLTTLSCANNEIRSLDIFGNENMIRAYTEGVCEDFGADGLWYAVYGENEYGDEIVLLSLGVDASVDIYAGEEPEKPVPGDADGDGKVEPKDLTRLMKSILKVDGNEVSPETADLNNDDVVDILDVICLVRKLAGAGA